MGITIKCKKTGRSCDCSYFGFARLRRYISSFMGDEVYRHYEDLFELMSHPIFMEQTDSSFELYDEETDRMIEKGILKRWQANFLYESDCDGSISTAVCKKLRIILEEADDDFVFGYKGHKDCAKMKVFKELLDDCIKENSRMTWM